MAALTVSFKPNLFYLKNIGDDIQIDSLYLYLYLYPWFLLYCGQLNDDDDRLTMNDDDDDDDDVHVGRSVRPICFALLAWKLEIRCIFNKYVSFLLFAVTLLDLTMNCIDDL